MAGIKGRSGPALGNMNAVRNGTSLRLTLGDSGPKLRRQTQTARKYRRLLESLTAQAHGEVNATMAHLIDEATTAEMHACICRHILRERLPDLSPTDIARCSEQILKAKTVRNRAVERLNLDAPAVDPWLVLNAPIVSDDLEESSDAQASNAEAG